MGKNQTSVSRQPAKQMKFLLAVEKLSYLIEAFYFKESALYYEYRQLMKFRETMYIKIWSQPNLFLM